MNENLENNDWMKDAPKLATSQRKNPFEVPDGYFEQNTEQILSTVFLEQLRQKSISSFTIPENYFEELPEQIEAKIAVNKLLSIDHNGFNVPENYFETFQEKINGRLPKAEVKKKTRILRLWQSDLMKYASAACFVILSASGLYFYQNNEVYIPQAQTTDFSNEQMLYDIDENVIIDHVENSTTTPIKVSASDTEMENYILNHYSPTDLVQELKQ